MNTAWWTYQIWHALLWRSEWYLLVTPLVYKDMRIPSDNWYCLRGNSPSEISRGQLCPSSLAWHAPAKGKVFISNTSSVKTWDYFLTMETAWGAFPQVRFGISRGQFGPSNLAWHTLVKGKVFISNTMSVKTWDYFLTKDTAQEAY